MPKDKDKGISIEDFLSLVETSGKYTERQIFSFKLSFSSLSKSQEDWVNFLSDK